MSWYVGYMCFSEADSYLGPLVSWNAVMYLQNATAYYIYVDQTGPTGGLELTQDRKS